MALGCGFMTLISTGLCLYLFVAFILKDWTMGGGSFWDLVLWESVLGVLYNDDTEITLVFSLGVGYSLKYSIFLRSRSGTFRFAGVGLAERPSNGAALFRLSDRRTFFKFGIDLVFLFLNWLGASGLWWTRLSVRL